MNQFFTAGLAFLVTLALLGIGRRPKKLFKKNFVDESSFNSLTPSVLVQKGANISQGQLNAFNPHRSDWCAPISSNDSKRLARELFQQIKGTPLDRLNAVTIAAKWGDLSILPILRRGLRDPDGRVVQVAAQGIDRFRRTTKKNTSSELAYLPPNVSRIR